jgi:hypothetical protein
VPTGNRPRLQGVSEANLGMRGCGYSPKRICRCLLRNPSRIGKRLTRPGGMCCERGESVPVSQHKLAIGLRWNSPLENNIHHFTTQPITGLGYASSIQRFYVEGQETSPGDHIDLQRSQARCDTGLSSVSKHVNICSLNLHWCSSLCL